MQKKDNNFLITIKFFLIGIIFSLSLIYIGSFLFEPPKIYSVFDENSSQFFYQGQILKYNISYHNNTFNDSIILYKYDSGCFNVFINNSFAYKLCKTNHSAAFPFLYVFPEGKKTSASVIFYLSLNKKLTKIDNYTIYKKSSLNYNGIKAFLLVDSFNDTYITDENGVILHANTTTFEANLLNLEEFH